MTTNSALQELLDKAGIRDTMMKYARGIDRHDLDLVASTFTSHAYADYVGRKAHGLDSILMGLQESLSRSDHRTHFMGDQQINLNGNEADVETYAIDYILYTVEGSQYMSMGGLRYQDKMVKYNHDWRVQHRVLHIDWRRNGLIDTTIPGREMVLPSPD